MMNKPRKIKAEVDGMPEARASDPQYSGDSSVPSRFFPGDLWEMSPATDKPMTFSGTAEQWLWVADRWSTKTKKRVARKEA